jgi:sarcosine oxidase subunit gamma
MADAPLDVTMEWLPRRVQTDVRHHDGPALGLPAQPNTTAALPTGPALWLGPDEWLVFGGGWSAAAGLAAERDWRARADAAVDVSAQRVGLALTGPHARALLSFGCALDLHPDVFPVGACAQTLCARVPVVLSRPEEDGYWLLVRPSTAGYLAAFLTDARTAG